jgi:hypothetical protein
MAGPYHRLAKNMNTPTRIAICILSAGWLLPLWLGVSAFLGFCDAEVLPLLYGHHPLNSFPYIHFTQQCIGCSLFWLAIVILYWSWMLSAAVRHDGKTA